MSKIKEFLIATITTLVVSFLLIFWDGKGDTQLAIEVWMFLLVFYYLYSSGEGMFEINSSMSTGQKLVSAIGLLIGARLVSVILAWIITNILSLLT